MVIAFSKAVINGIFFFNDTATTEIYTLSLHDALPISDYPKIDFELIRKHFKEWEHHKVEDILTYRNKSFSSPVTGSVAPLHHTPWEKAMDDSMKTFLNK